MVVVNVRDDDDREWAERTLRDLKRLRKDRDVFDDVIGRRGSSLMRLEIEAQEAVVEGGYPVAVLP